MSFGPEARPTLQDTFPTLGTILSAREEGNGNVAGRLRIGRQQPQRDPSTALGVTTKQDCARRLPEDRGALAGKPPVAPGDSEVSGIGAPVSLIALQIEDFGLNGQTTAKGTRPVRAALRSDKPPVAPGVRIMAWLRQTMAPAHPQYTLCGSTAKVWHPADHGLASPDHGTRAPAIHTLQLRRQSVAPGGSWPGFARPWHPAACVSAGSEISCARKSTIKLGGKPARNAEREVRSEQQQRNSRRDPSLRSG